MISIDPPNFVGMSVVAYPDSEIPIFGTIVNTDGRMVAIWVSCYNPCIAFAPIEKVMEFEEYQEIKKAKKLENTVKDPPYDKELVEVLAKGFEKW